MDWSKLISIATITSLLTCFLLVPFWILAFIVIAIVQAFDKKPPKLELVTILPSRPEPITILPSNEFAEDWEFRIYELERN
jgi:hypothetical protein